jgi:hypothetical protein
MRFMKSSPIRGHTPRIKALYLCIRCTLMNERVKSNRLSSLFFRGLRGSNAVSEVSGKPGRSQVPNYSSGNPQN